MIESTSSPHDPSVIPYVKSAMEPDSHEHTRRIQPYEQDALTGFLNHDSMIRRVTSYLSDASDLQSLFVIDLDNFKQVNDRFGHTFGDEALTHVAEVISNAFRATDLIGRLGGDEFMVLMKDVQSRAFVEHKAEELIDALQFSSTNDGRQVNFSASIGITIFMGGEKDFPTLYDEADGALFQAKKAGKKGCCIYSAEFMNPRHNKPSAVLENVSVVQLRTLLENMDGGVVMAEVSDDISVTYISPSLYRSFGRNVEDESYSRETIFSFTYPEDLPALRKVLFAAAESDEAFEHTYRAIMKDGVAWRRIRVRRIPDSEDGVHHLVGVISDITDLKQVSQRLEEVRERYYFSVERTQSWLWEVDISSRTMQLIGMSWDSLGLRRKIFVDAPESYLQISPMITEAQANFQRMFDDIYAGKDGGFYVYSTKDVESNTIWVEAQFTLIKDENGVPYKALGVSIPSPRIENDMRLFEQELHFSDIVKDSILGYLRVNLTKNLIEAINVNGVPEYSRFLGFKYDDYHDIVCEKFTSSKDYLQFRHTASREHLLGKIKQGDNIVCLDYRRAQGTSRWTWLFVKLMRHPISGDYYGFGYFRDNEVCKNWELSAGFPLQRNPRLMIFTPDTMAAISQHILEKCGRSQLVSLCVIEILDLERIRDIFGQDVTAEMLQTYGLLCRIAIGGDVAVGQLDESRFVLLRTDVSSYTVQRERITMTVTLLKKMLSQAYPKAEINLTSGFVVEPADRTSYRQLLKKALIACQTASRMLGEAGVGYQETGFDLPEADISLDDLNERYRVLEQWCQQLAEMNLAQDYDELTGIWNRRAFFRHAREILDANPQRQYAIVLLDINRFKIFNDVRGMVAGDQMLRDIAQRMFQKRGPDTYCARWGADYFVLLTLDDMASIERSKDYLVRWMAEKVPEFNLSFSFGIYHITDPSIEVSLMCERALIASTSVKNSFETRIASYDDKLRDQMLDEQALINDMSAAIEQEQFELYYQPQIDYAIGRQLGAEALVRWNHPKRGLLPPGVFIPLLEKNGLITRLDSFVWERCCRQIRDWKQKYPHLTPSISVNVSRLDFYELKLWEIFSDLIQKYGLQPTDLRLEVTESAYMNNPIQLVETVRHLQEAGFTVEMDDFGSAFSSLNSLMDVPVDLIKLDRNFITSCTTNSRGSRVLSSVISMAKLLDLPLIAEGVETMEQADYLKSLGCTVMQGYYFSYPLKVDEFEKFMLRWS